MTPDNAAPGTRPPHRLPFALRAVLWAVPVVVLVVAAVMAWWSVRISFESHEGPHPTERRGVPAAQLQKTFRLAVPEGAVGASYLYVPGDGSAESGQDLYLRFRTTPVGLKAFVGSMGGSLDDLTAQGGANGYTIEQDELDTVGLQWRIGTGSRLFGLYVERPEPRGVTGTAVLTIDETDAAAPLVYAVVTV